MNSLEEEAVEVACLGRPFQLGMLYDLRSDILIPGLTLWDNNTIQRHKHVIPKKYTQMAISCSDSLEDKASSMDISGSLKLSVMSGRVNLEGSAKYFNDNKKSTKQSRITLTYHVNTHFEHLTMDHLDPEKFKYTEIFDSGLGTHVVIAVLYGANAYFVFKRDLTSNDDKTEIEGSFKASISSINGMSVAGRASGEVNESDKSVTDSFSCTFYGDFTLPANPFSFEDAIDMYNQLPSMLGERGENAVPLKVWLYPLAKLNSKAAKLVCDISNSLITAVTDAIEALNIAEMRCDDLAFGTVAQTFPAFHQKIQELKENCYQYKLDLLKEVGSLLPLIHGGEKEENDLADLLKSYEESPFSSTALDQWLKIKEQESDVLKVFLKKLEWTAQDVHKSTVFASLDPVACFTFTSLDGPDLFLDYLSEYMKEKQKKSIKPESWLTPDIGQRMRKNLKLFTDLQSSSTSDNIKFTMVSERDEEHPGACIMVYGDECDGAVCFTLPSKPTCSATDTVSHSSITVKLSPVCEDSVKRNLQYKKNQEEEWKCLPVLQGDEKITLVELDADTEYQIRCTAVGQLKYTVTSDIISVQTLKGTHPPADITHTTDTSQPAAEPSTPVNQQQDHQYQSTSSRTINTSQPAAEPSTPVNQQQNHQHQSTSSRTINTSQPQHFIQAHQKSEYKNDVK